MQLAANISSPYFDFIPDAQVSWDFNERGKAGDTTLKFIRLIPNAYPNRKYRMQLGVPSPGHALPRLNNELPNNKIRSQRTYTQHNREVPKDAWKRAKGLL